MARNVDATVDDNSEDDGGAVLDFAKALEKATLVSNTADVSPNKEGTVLAKQPDLGIITSISGTPAKNSLQDHHNINSPVFKKKPNHVFD